MTCSAVTGDVFLHNGIVNGLAAPTSLLGTVPPPCIDVKRADLDGNGAEDIYVGARDANATYFIPNNGTALGAIRVLVPDVPFVRLGEAVDMDNDGASLCKSRVKFFFRRPRHPRRQPRRQRLRLVVREPLQRR